MKLCPLSVAVAAFASVTLGAEVELTGWKSTNPKCKLLPGRGITGGTAMGMQGEVGRSQRFYTWKADPVTLKTNGVYGMSFHVNRARSGSEVLCRTAYHNLMVSDVDPGWREIRTVMRMPVDDSTISIALSDYNCQAETLFDRSRLVELEPRYRTESGITLGRGEVLTGNHYYFMSQHKCVGGGDTRALVGLKGSSSGDKFVLKANSEVLHRFDICGRRFLNGRGMLHVSYLQNAAVDVDASADGLTWTRLAVVTNAEPCDLAFPASLFPARSLWLRLKSSEGLKKGAVCQIDTVHFDGAVDGEPVYLAGATTYVEKESGAIFATIDTMKYRVATPGALLPGSDDGFALWGASSGYKIFRDTAVPVVRADALRIKAAANESESAQLVVTPKKDVADLRVEAGALKKKKRLFSKGAEIPASAVEVLRVGYVDVRIVTDKVGQAGLWPDPLPPQDKTPLAVKSGENQPMWITVTVPKGTPKGVYCGELKVVADGICRTVPLEVEVFGFELPDRMSLRAPFGLAPKRLYAYHKAKTAADRDRIREMYIKFLSEHRITPFYWGREIFPKARLKNSNDPEKVSVEIDFAAWDREMEMVVDKYHGNVVKLYPEGLGGGNQDNRHPAQICGVKRGDPRYERIMKEYLEKFVLHLREKGWLEYAFLYWFDEPQGQDYDFVSQGMATLKKYAPELRRMITNICIGELMDGVDMWCPLVQHLHVPMERVCRQRGDEMWWYICCSPREAPVGEHIDHPGTDMRVWSWQNWGENVTGSLVWVVDWWSGKTRYPDPANPQDPYLDPMSWGKKFNPKRITATWCNGDGRYVYPPLACKDAQQPQTVFDEPVSCYRLAMFRDGVEDYEYFAMLKRLDPKNPLLAVPKSVYTDLFSYTHDPLPMEQHRERLAREIESKMSR